MAYTVTFYTFSKKENSTARPTAAGTNVSCKLKDGSGILNPIIVVDWTPYNNITPHAYNYAYISEFSRYYRIADIQYVFGLWEYSLHVDVLASWKTNIGNVNTFIRRSSADTSKRFPDDAYPAFVSSTIQNVMNPGNFSSNLGNGFFVLSVVGSNATGVGAVNYYAMELTTFKSVVNVLFNDPSWLNITDITDDLQKALFNPIQYITSCMFYPFNISNLTAKTSSPNIKFGWWTITNYTGTVYVLTGTPHVEMGISMQIPKHPDAAARGDYMNLSPQSTYNIYYLPYGSWVLDPTILVNYRTLVLAQTIDMINGQGTLMVGCYNDITEVDDWFDMRIAQIGVPISMAQASTDLLGSLMSTGINFVSAAATGNIAGVIKGGLETFASMVPKAQISGTTGGFNTYNLNVILQAQFFRLADENANVFGNPCYSNGTISNHAGYIEAEPGLNEIPCTEPELMDINNYFTNGFYYE